MRGELPIRVIDEPGRPLRLAGLCGAEVAVTADGSRISADASPAALMRMVLHARSCQRCKNEAADAARAVRLRLPAGGGRP